MIRNNLGHNFPTIDYFDSVNKTVGSNKSYDLASKTYSDSSRWLRIMKSDIRKLNKFTAKSWGEMSVTKVDYDKKILNVVIPNMNLSEAHVKAIYEAKEYANELGVLLKVYVTK